MYVLAHEHGRVHFGGIVAGGGDREGHAVDDGTFEITWGFSEGEYGDGVGAEVTEEGKFQGEGLGVA